MLLYTLSLLLLGLGGYLMGKFFKWMETLDQDVASPCAVYLENPDSTQPVPLPSIHGAPSKSLSIIVPAYNEEERLEATLDETIGYLAKRRDRQGPQFTYEIIVVDDGSKDATVKVAMNFVRKYGFDTVRVLRVPVNHGKGHAVKRGMLVARGEYCLMMDADGATKFTDLEKLEEALEKAMVPTFARSKSSEQPAAGDSQEQQQGPMGAAFGSRSHLERAATVKRTKLRNFLMHGFHMLVVFVAGGRIRDTQCGFKLFTRRAAALLYSNLRLQRWCFDVELLYLAEQLAIPVTEVNVNWTEMPGSKLRITSVVHMALELALIKIAYQIVGMYKVQPVVSSEGAAVEGKKKA